MTRVNGKPALRCVTAANRAYINRYKTARRVQRARRQNAGDFICFMRAPPRHARQRKVAVPPRGTNETQKQPHVYRDERHATIIQTLERNGEQWEQLVAGEEPRCRCQQAIRRAPNHAPRVRVRNACARGARARAPK